VRAAFLLLHQYRLSDLQVYLLQAKKDLAYLQCPIEVGEMSGPRARDTCQGEEVLLDSLGSDATDITLCVHLPCYPTPSPRQGAAPGARRPLHLKEMEPYNNE
jgi:hypothetical protein